MLEQRKYSPQTCDMGYGVTEYAPKEPMNLEEVLDEIENWDCYGVITIIDTNGEILRKFDFDIYSFRRKYKVIEPDKKEFYHRFWGYTNPYDQVVDRVISRHCFMVNDIIIYLSDKIKRVT